MKPAYGHNYQEVYQVRLHLDLIQGGAWWPYDMISSKPSYLFLHSTVMTQLPLNSVNYPQRSLLILSWLKWKRTMMTKQIRRPGGLFDHLVSFTIRNKGDVYARRHTCN